MVKQKNNDLVGTGAAGDLEDREAAAMQRVMDAKAGDRGDSDWKVFVMRLAGPNRRKDGTEARIMECGVDDLETLSDTIRKEFGDGTYRVRVRKDGRNLDQWDLEIELSPAERAQFRRKVALLEEQPAQLPTVRENDSDIARVIGEAMRYQADMMKGMIESLRPQAAAIDPMTQFANMMAAFKGFQEALPRTEQEAGLSMFEKGMQFAEKFMDRSGGGAEPTTLLGVVREVLANPEIGGALKEFAKGAARMAQQPPGNRRPMRQLGQRPGGPRVAAGVAAAERAPAPPPAPEKNAEQRAIEYLIGQAEIGSQPELVADTALQLIPKDKLDLLDSLEGDAALNLLIQFYPDVGKHRDWFTALLNAMYEPEGTAETGDDGQTEGEPPPDAS
jgi:hypothetical protein